MKKIMKSVVVAIFLIGLSGFLFWKFQYNQVSISEEQEIDVRNIKSVSVQTDTEDMKILPKSGNKISVSVSGEISEKHKEQYRLSVIENGGKLEILYLREDKLGISFGSDKDLDVTVSLPEKVYHDLMLSTVSGDIVVKGIKGENLEIESSSGDVTVQESRLEGNTTIQSTSGNVFLAQNEINEFTIESSSGKVDLIDGNSRNGQIQTVSGRIKVAIQEAMNDLRITSNSGDIATSFEKEPKSLSVKYKGSSGKPDIHLAGMVYEIKDEHHVVGMVGNGEKTLTVKSTSGDFTAK